MQDIEDKERYINTGRLIHILSNQMKRRKRLKQWEMMA